MGAHISIPMYNRSISERYRLKAFKCKECGTINFPKKAVCYNCKTSSDFEEVALSGKGTVYAYTLIAPAGAPPEFEDEAIVKQGYPVAIIELDEGPKIISQLVNANSNQIGMKVKACFRKIYTEEQIIRYGYKFEPI